MYELTLWKKPLRASVAVLSVHMETTCGVTQLLSPAAADSLVQEQWTHPGHVSDQSFPPQTAAAKSDNEPEAAVWTLNNELNTRESYLSVASLPQTPLPFSVLILLCRFHQYKRYPGMFLFFYHLIHSAPSRHTCIDWSYWSWTGISVKEEAGRWTDGRQTQTMSICNLSGFFLFNPLSWPQFAFTATHLHTTD